MLTFLIPTAKDMKPADTSYTHQLSPESEPILQALTQLSTEELAKAYKIKPEAAQREAQRLTAIAEGTSPAYPAYQLFNGLMYRHILTRNLTQAQRDYFLQRVYIASSFYGIIPVNYPIAEHRLDFQTKVRIANTSLKQYWRPKYDQFAQEHTTIVSLLSSEFESVFSKHLKSLWISPVFMEEKEGQLKTHATISKKARGDFLTACIAQQCQTKKDLKKLVFSGFCYDNHRSTDTTYVYIKKEA